MTVSERERLTKIAGEALQNFEEKIPYLIWNQASAVMVVGRTPPADDQTFHDALDQWEADIIDSLRLSENLRNAQAALVVQIYGPHRGRSPKKKIEDNWQLRDLEFKSELERIRNLRLTRSPR